MAMNRYEWMQQQKRADVIADLAGRDTVLIVRWPAVDGPDGPAFYYGPMHAGDANRRMEELAARSDHPQVSSEKMHDPHEIPERHA